MIDLCQSILEGNPPGLPRTGYAGFAKTIQAGHVSDASARNHAVCAALRWVEAGVFTAFNAGQ